MTTEALYPDYIYEDVVARLEEAQTRMLNDEDLSWAAHAAAMLAVAAADRGWIPLAVIGHRTAIHAYNLECSTEALRKDADIEPAVSSKALGEYIRLAETLSKGPRSLYAHRNLHSLKRETLLLGPLGNDIAVHSIAVVAEIEARLATHSLTRRGGHYNQSRQLGSICMIAGQAGGLPLQLVEEYGKPRIVRDWITDIENANIV